MMAPMTIIEPFFFSAGLSSGVDFPMMILHLAVLLTVRVILFLHIKIVKGILQWTNCVRVLKENCGGGVICI